MHERQWINWHSVPQLGAKPRKVPTDARTGNPIDHLKPANWLTHDEAAATGLPVGFVLTADDPYFVIDVDGVRDPVTGAWDQRALELLAMFPGAFAEVSVSGNGIHIWGRCGAIGPRRKKFELNNGLKIEFYTSGRFIALGTSNNGGGMDLDWTDTLAAIVPVGDPAEIVALSDTVDPAWNGPTDDDELLALAMKSKGGAAARFGDAASFADLFTANVAVLSRCYPSVSGGDFDHSSADQALANALAFWTGKNAVRMARLFRRSGLMRAKWERADYRASTISKAVSSTRNVYNRPTLPAGVTAPRARAFDNIMNDARNLAADDVTAIKRLCSEAATLGPVEKAAVLRQIRMNTDVPMADLKKQADGKDGEPDHLELARKAVASIGAENIIHAGQFTWKFDARGVWKQCDDRELKQRVQLTLAAEHYAVTAARVSGVTDVLKNDIHKPAHEFNLGKPESVNCLNGELELIDGRWVLHPHRRDQYRTTQIPVSYDPDATAPLFERFLLDIFRDDPDRDDKIRVVLEMMGYSLMGHANREKFVLLIGAGANGKSVLLATLEALLGKQNVAGVQPASFDNKFQRGHLDQKLANIITELKQGETIADAELKAITSGEPATVEHKNKDPFVIRPFATCWFGTNHMPHTRDYSDAFFRRALVITFNRVFEPHEQDSGLKDKLKAELPGILNHALNAYAGVVSRNAFTVPASSVSAQRKWQVEADQVAQFVEERCETRTGGTVSISFLYSTYQGWAQAMGIRNMLGQLQFGNRLEQLGYRRTRTRAERMFTGIVMQGMP
ncbi:phage/plasmid primase, P4 family [Rhizobium sp. GN54]|nr:phage/plasmid primase, P4 family [Rhizobium sp. GN54]